MKLQKILKRAVAPAVLLTATFAVAAWTQESGSDSQNMPASESFQQVGEQIEQAAHSAYQGAKTAVNDTSITLKVKTALHDDQATCASDIHVSTTAGVVTLKGTVPSSSTLAHAKLLARSTQGVRHVVNDLQVAPATD